jgi:hypothetical protein
LTPCIRGNARRRRRRPAGVAKRGQGGGSAPRCTVAAFGDHGPWSCRTCGCGDHRRGQGLLASGVRASVSSVPPVFSATPREAWRAPGAGRATEKPPFPPPSVPPTRRRAILYILYSYPPFCSISSFL